MKKTITFDATQIEHGEKLDLPWHLIKPEFICAGMDKDRRIHVFRDRPKLRFTVWCGNSGGNLSALDIDTSGVDFKESLVMRPQNN